MTKFYQTIILGVLMITLLGNCVTTNMQSDKSPDFTQKISKIYITVKTTGSSKMYMKAFAKYTLTALKTHNVEAAVHYFDPESSERANDILKKIKNYNPDVIMEVEQTESRMASGAHRNGTVTGATLDIKLYLPNKESPVWKGSLKADGSLGLASAAQSSAKKIVQKLKVDGMIN